MAKTCIICGSSAGSREHVFPAALGGRRTNKGIYCTADNNFFGRHVAELEQQLAMLNAIVEVRSDHRNGTKPFVFTHEDGSNLSIVGQSIEPALPDSLDPLKVESGDKFSMKFSSMEQYEKWREVQRKNGLDVRIIGEPGPQQQQFFAAPVTVRLFFGGAVAFQAIAYLALTYFAQYFPNEVRQSSFDTIKEYLKLDLSQAENQEESHKGFVRWDTRDAEQMLGQNPFTFGHAVAVGVSKVTNRAYGYVSFFSALNYVIDLGPVEDAEDAMARVFIDPKADRAPNDIQEDRYDMFSIDLAAPPYTLEGVNQSDAAMKRFMAKVAEKHFDKFVTDLAAEITAWKQSSSGNDPRQFAEELINRYSQRILNLLTEVSTGLKPHLPEPLQPILDHLVVPDDKAPNGISLQTASLLTMTKEAIKEAMVDELDNNAAPAESIAMLLNGGTGVAVVTQKVILPVLQSAVS